MKYWRMGRQKRYTILELEPGAYVTLALAVLAIPLPWVISWITAAAFHELLHYGMVLLTGGRAERVKITPMGVQMEVHFSTWVSEILSAAAGPCAGLLLVLVARWMPRIALCGLFQSICNLIPVYPLDGGRVLSGLLHWLKPGKAEGILNGVSFVTILIIFCVCLYLVVFMDLGLVPLLFAGCLALRTGKIKIPCKDGPLRVQ